MEIISDLHIHGCYSRATSKQLSFANLEKYAKIKGVNLLGTGDFTHPKWIEDIKKLKEDDSGILYSETGFPFVLQTEISLVYTQDEKGRRVHVVVLAPDVATVLQITEYLKSKGRVDYDGRPIFKIPCDEFVESLKKINPKIEIIPAHIWTPWFSMFGSKSGFNSIKDCFKDQLKHIHAIETGLSSDPEMNWRLSQLDPYSIVSFSDLHSFWPWRIGREATIFEMNKLSYDNIIKALKEKSIKATIEVDPAYGKYHWDGHRKCNIVFSPKESLKHKGICPVCKKPLTIGVEYRVEELADRDIGYKPKDAKPFHKLIPLSELLSVMLKKGVATNTVWKEYNTIMKGRNEFDVLLRTPEKELLKVTNAKIVDAIIKNRNNNIHVQPGYDGVYGKAIFDDSIQKEILQRVKSPQKSLGEF